MIFEGRALKYGDAINTDVIFPGKFTTLVKPEEMATVAMYGVDPEFPKKIKDAGIVIAGRNFGCGSSREHAPIAMKYAGTKCILAESFARIFFRNAINIGLPILECKGIHSKVNEGDLIFANLSTGEVVNKTTGETLKAKPIPEFLQRILNSGGLIEYVNAKG